MDDNLNLDDIDFSKTKRGKGKSTPKRWSLLIVEGIIVLIAIVAGGRFLFADNANTSNLQATIDARPTQAPSLTATDLYNRALGEADEGLISSAIQSLTVALELDPTYADAYFQRAELNYDEDRFYDATKDYEAALQHNYDDALYAMFRLGMARYNRDDYWNAVMAFDEVIESDPTDAEAYYWRGRANSDSGAYEHGIEDILQAIELGYDQPVYAYFFLAQAYDEIEAYDEAIANYTRSLSYSSEDCERYYCWIDYNNRGTSYYWSGDYETAIEDYTRSIQANPDEYPLALKNRGDAYNKLGEMNLALGDWNTMFQLIAGDVTTFTLSDERPILRESLDFDDTQAHVEFAGNIGDVVTITLTVPDTSNLDAMLLLRDPNGNPMAYSAPGNDPNAALSEIVLVDDGRYTILVASNLARTSGAFTLSLEK